VSSLVGILLRNISVDYVVVLCVCVLLVTAYWLRYFDRRLLS
jgi:hypothetical protein